MHPLAQKYCTIPESTIASVASKFTSTSLFNSWSKSRLWGCGFTCFPILVLYPWSAINYHTYLNCILSSFRRLLSLHLSAVSREIWKLRMFFIWQFHPKVTILQIYRHITILLDGLRHAEARQNKGIQCKCAQNSACDFGMNSLQRDEDFW